MNSSRKDGRLRPGLDVGGGARQRAGGGQSGEQRRSHVGDALADQFDVGAMAPAGHAIGDDAGQQALDAG